MKLLLENDYSNIWGIFSILCSVLFPIFVILFAPYSFGLEFYDGENSPLGFARLDPKDLLITWVFVCLLGLFCGLLSYRIQRNFKASGFTGIILNTLVLLSGVFTLWPQVIAQGW